MAPKLEVPDTAELRRVLSLPRREPAPDVSAEFRRSPRAKLMPEQNQWLHDLVYGGHMGLFGSIDAGRGKTLATLIAAMALGCQRPVLMLPKRLMAKTRREFSAYAKHWHVRMPILLGYEEMGRGDRHERLNELGPDVLLCDEAHYLRNTGAGVTKKVIRYLLERPGTKFLPMSASLYGERLIDCHHLLLMALGEEAMPLPSDLEEAQLWSYAVDAPDRWGTKYGMGALSLVPGGVWEWLRGTAGVVPTEGVDECPVSLEISTWRPRVPRELREVLDRVGATGCRPDGEALEDNEVSSCISQLQCGFFLRWKHRPPEDWLTDRARWFKYARGLLRESNVVDTLGQLEDAMNAGVIEKHPLLTKWQWQRSRYKPSTTPVWITDDIMRQVARHVAKQPTLVWTPWRAPGEMLGCYYGQGTDPSVAPNDRSIVVSAGIAKEGLNLQHWHRNLFLDVPGSELVAQQRLARTHRTGQTHPCVQAQFLCTTDHNKNKLKRLKKQVEYAIERTGSDRKLSIATWVDV